MRKIILIVVGIVVAIAAASFLRSQKKSIEDLPTPKMTYYNVDTVEAATKNVHETRRFLAQLLAGKSALIASKFSAEIKRIHVKENDMVKKGAILISLDDAEIRASIASLQTQTKALKADLANAKTQLERNKLLLESGGLSQEKYDNSLVLHQNKASALESSEQTIKQLDAQLNYLNIKAPFSGRVGTIFVDAGNLAVPGKPIISLNSDDQKLIFSYVETSQAIIEGQKVLLEGQVIGRVARRYDDAQNALLVAEIKLSVPLHYANKSFLNVEVVTAETKGCSVPLNALLHRKDETLIMIYREGHFEPFSADIILQDGNDAVLTACPDLPVAVASEAKLALLPALGKITLERAK
jgi:RND family efflux transporter MFP subunit